MELEESIMPCCGLCLIRNYENKIKAVYKEIHNCCENLFFNKSMQLCFFYFVFSSPEPKAQVSFSDHNLSVVCRCRRCCKLFTFSSSSQEPQGRFQPNLAQSTTRWRGFKFVQMKGHALFKGEIIQNYWKFVGIFQKSSS